MNDRLKFRVWDIRNREYFKDPVPPLNSDGTLAFQSSHPDFQKYYITEQCTGLSDKNGNLIYEGDVIKDKFDNTYLIKWFNAKFICEDQAEMQPIFSPSQELLLNWGVKIIGNIHEQAEQKDVK